jgi:excisionase family DNA binding protein
VTRSVRITRPSLLSTHQVAQYLGVSAPTVVNWVNTGRLEAVRTPGGHRRIAKDDVVSFARSHGYPVPAELAANTGRVLLVDDEPDFSTLVREYLTNRGGLEVEVADSGFAAGLAIARFRPAVVLMDILMPDMDGFQVLRMLRSDPDMRSIPVVAVTAFRDEGIEERVLREGFAAYVEKPVRLDKLTRLVQAILEGREPEE